LSKIASEKIALIWTGQDPVDIEQGAGNGVSLFSSLVPSWLAKLTAGLSYKWGVCWS